MSTPGKRAPLPRFTVHDSPVTGWTHVRDSTRPAHDSVIAGFGPGHRSRAVKFAEDLNVHELAEQLRAAPNAAPGFRRLELPPVTDAQLPGGSIAPRPLRDDERPVKLSDGLAVVPDAALERYGHLFFSALGNVPADRVFGVSELAGRVHKFEWRPRTSGGQPPVTACAPCQWWSGVGETEDQARAEFVAHVEAVAKIDVMFDENSRLRDSSEDLS